MVLIYEGDPATCGSRFGVPYCRKPQKFLEDQMNPKKVYGSYTLIGIIGMIVV